MRAGAVAALLLALGGPTTHGQAAPLDGLAGAPPGASSCSGCHAPGATSALPPIHGRPSAELVAALAAFRTGERPATVMDRIAKGFSPDESLAIADWLSARR
jgi:cytochrome c553